jgi:hypothetical protein
LQRTIRRFDHGNILSITTLSLHLSQVGALTLFQFSLEIALVKLGLSSLAG